MAVQRFGPVQGAGVSVTEKKGDVRLQASPLGVTLMIGEFEKGPKDDIQITSGRSNFDTRNGARLPNSDAPKAAQDFFKTGAGAGILITYRVTGGDEVASSLDLYTRQGIASPPASGRSLLGRLTAKNGGVWGGRRRTYVDEHTGAGDLTATTLDTGDTMVENEWAGGTLELKKVTTKTYRIVGNTAAGVVSVEADQDLLSDFTAGGGTPANRYVLSRENLDHLEENQSLAAAIYEGTENPTSEFAIVLYEDGVRVRKWDNLSTDPTKVNYWVNIINKDKSNYWVTATDLYVGDKTVAAVRPSNFYGESKALTALTLTLPDPDVTVNSVGGADPTVVVNSLGSAVKSQTITLTVENAGADLRLSTDLGPLDVVHAGFTGVPFDAGDELIDFTVTNGGTPLADGDTIVIQVLVLEPGELVGGTVYPDFVNEPNLGFIIDSNTVNTVSVRAGLDLTDDGAIAAGEIFQLRWAQQFDGGNDSRPVTDADYLLAFDPNLSPINKLFGKNLGLVKMATPGVTSTVVVKNGLAYAKARNYQFRYEIPANIIDEAGAIDHVNTTIGRSDYGKINFPSFGSVLDPDATPGAADVPLKQQTLTGMILGREAAIARDNNGYHKTEAGTEADLPEVLELPTGDPETAVALNEELLNPQGINVVKFRQGTVIMWGARTTSVDAEWQWSHQRELMSYYENILRENLDFIVFQLNNLETQERVKTSIRDFFLKEYNKGALFSEENKFDGGAYVLKIDEENNTTATRAAGDLNAEISLRLVDTVERFNILIGKQGIFDSVG